MTTEKWKRKTLMKWTLYRSWYHTLNLREKSEGDEFGRQEYNQNEEEQESHMIFKCKTDKPRIHKVLSMQVPTYI